MSNLVFNFNSKKSKNLKNPKFILGGKGANLAQMRKLGLPFLLALQSLRRFAKFFTKIIKN